MKEEETKKGSGLSPTTKTRLANLFNRLPKLGRDRGEGEQETGGKRAEKVRPNSSVSGKTSVSGVQQSVR